MTRLSYSLFQLPVLTSRKPHYSGPLSVQAVSTLFAGRRSGGHRQRGWRGRRESQAGRPGDCLQRLWRLVKCDYWMA